MTSSRKTIGSSVRGVLELVGLTVIADLFNLQHIDTNEIERIRKEGLSVTFFVGKDSKGVDISHLHPGESGRNKEISR